MSELLYKGRSLNTTPIQNDVELAEIKLLGWNVPDECPIQNGIDGNKFIQRVGRVDMGTLDWRYTEKWGAGGIFGAYDNFGQKKILSQTEIPNIYCSKYPIVKSRNDLSASLETAIGYSGMDGSSYKDAIPTVRDTTYTSADTFKSAMNGVYFYFELATPIETVIDGNETIVEIQRKLSQAYITYPSQKIWTTNYSSAVSNNGGIITIAIGGIVDSAVSVTPYSTVLATLPEGCRPRVDTTISFKYSTDMSNYQYVMALIKPDGTIVSGHGSTAINMKYFFITGTFGT